MKSQKEETPDKLKRAVEDFNRYIESLPDEKLDQIIADIDAMGIKGPSVDEYFAGLSRKETPVKPDFEAMALQAFEEARPGNIAMWTVKPDDEDAIYWREVFKKGAERIWNDYVASKEVDKKVVIEGDT